MTKFKIVILFITYLIFGSCNQKESDLFNPGACAVVFCAIPEQSFNLKFLDKNTEADLLFSNIINSPKYKLADVKIYSSRFKKNVDFKIDSTNKTNKILVFSTLVTDEFIISLGNLPTDKLSAETQFIDQPCCNQLKLTKLTLNSAVIPFVQFTPTTIILKK